MPSGSFGNCVYNSENKIKRLLEPLHLSQLKEMSLFSNSLAAKYTPIYRNNRNMSTTLPANNIDVNETNRNDLHLPPLNWNCKNALSKRRRNKRITRACAVVKNAPKKKSSSIVWKMAEGSERTCFRVSNVYGNDLFPPLQRLPEKMETFEMRSTDRERCEKWKLEEERQR